MPGTIVSFVLADATIEIAFGQGVHELGEQIASGVHRQAPATVFRGKVYGIPGARLEIDTDEVCS